MTVGLLLRLPLLLICGVTAGAHNLAGRWSLDLDPDFSGSRSTVLCDIAQQSNDLTLECENLGVSAGTLDDRTVRFVVMTGENGLLPAKFTGLLGENGSVMTGTWRLEDVTGNRIGRFTAERR